MSSELSDTVIVMRPIGIIHSPFEAKDDATIQGRFSEDVEGSVEVFDEYAEGLQDVEGFSHLYLIYHFDRAGQVKLVRPTFLDDSPHGVFASRHHCRPNGIGITIVRLLKRDENRLRVGGIDVLDGTPLLDIKPYVRRFDCVSDSTEGWLADKAQRTKPSGRE